MSRLVLSIAICFPVFLSLESLADEPATPAALSKELAAALERGAEYACRQPERATTREANLLQASCVAVDLRAGKDPREIAGHCLGTANRNSFEEYAAKICGNTEI